MIRLTDLMGSAAPPTIIFEAAAIIRLWTGLIATDGSLCGSGSLGRLTRVSGSAEGPSATAPDLTPRVPSPTNKMLIRKIVPITAATRTINLSPGRQLLILARDMDAFEGHLIGNSFTPDASP